jgi:hypothetical protein
MKQEANQLSDKQRLLEWSLTEVNKAILEYAKQSVNAGNSSERQCHDALRALQYHSMMLTNFLIVSEKQRTFETIPANGAVVNILAESDGTISIRINNG